MSFSKRIYFLVFFVFVTGFIIQMYFQLRSGAKYKEHKEAYVGLLNFEERLLKAGEWVGWPKSKIKHKLERAEYHNDLATKEYNFSFAMASVFLVVALIFFFVTWLGFRFTIEYDEFVAYTLLTVAASSLILGIFLPMLEIGAYNYELKIPLEFTIPYLDVPVDLTKTFDGRMYYYYQNKSVMQLIGILFQDGNLVVGTAILLFSIVLPVIKLVFSFALLLNKYSAKWKFIKVFVYKIGKWSMADVFVAACFLAFLSFQNMNTGIDTESKTLIGLYFFLTYCVMSIASSLFIEKALQYRSAKV